jgi:hypothetical protein
MSIRFIWLPALGLLVSPAALSAQPTTGTVTGKVTYQGKPLVEGTVTFLTRVAKTSSKIHPDGRYKVSGIPVGPAFIRVESRGLAVPPSDKPGKSMPLPYTVRPGAQQHDIDLK